MAGEKVKGPANVGIKKEYASVADKRVGEITSPRFQSANNSGAGPDEGQIGKDAKFAKPMNEVNAEIYGMGKTHNDIGEVSGFITDGYLDKSGTPYGEAAKFNFLPPGMDITNQENATINDMPLRKIVAESYPGDGWMPAPRDIPE